MRIFAGAAKGRTLIGPRGDATRPFTGKAREAVFSILGGDIVGARVLDLYAGSGSLGLEALSRGAAEAVFVERGDKALDALRRNVEAVALGGRIVAGDVAGFLRHHGGEHDIVFVDPPYALGVDAVAEILGLVAPVVAAPGVVVVHRRAGTPMTLPTPGMLIITEHRRYGEGEVWWLDKETR